MNARYRALHEALGRINASLDGRGIQKSPYQDEDADNIYDMMAGLVPVGQRVRVTYIPNPAKLTKTVIREGVVQGLSRTTLDEPSFDVYFADSNTTLCVPGSVLEAI